MMQDNSFEKNMEHELHELNIEPSQKVWMAVEDALDKKKRRYIFGWWWLLPLLITGTGLVWYFNNNGTKENVIQNKKEIATQAGQDNQNGKSQGPAAQVIANDTAMISDTKNEGSVTGAANKKDAFTASSTKIKTTMPAAGEDAGHISVKKISAKAKQKITVTASDAEEDMNTDTSYSISMNDDEIAKNETSITVQADSITTSVKRENKELTTLINKDSLQPVSDTKEHKKLKISKWKKEWVLAGGISEFSNLNFFSSKLKSFNNNYDPILGGTPSNPIRIRTQYKFDRGIHLQAGLNIGRPLSSKISWLTGLHYNLQMIAADRQLFIDSLMTSGGTPNYSQVSSERYTEDLQVHSITIPLLMRFSFGKKLNLTTGLYNNISFASNWNKFSDILGGEKKYLPVVHVNPSFNIKQFSAGPLLNVGLRKYAIDRSMINYGLQLRYIPKK